MGTASVLRHPIDIQMRRRPAGSCGAVIIKFNGGCSKFDIESLIFEYIEYICYIIS